jgi:hypothetical protein
MFDVSKYTKSKWLRGSDLKPGRPVTVTIAKAYEHHFEESGETKPVLAFADFPQNLVLNKTRVLALIEAFGEDVRLWAGQRVNLMAVPSGFQNKPTVMLSAAESAPSFGGQEGDDGDDRIPF